MCGAAVQFPAREGPDVLGWTWRGAGIVYISNACGASSLTSRTGPSHDPTRGGRLGISAIQYPPYKSSYPNTHVQFLSVQFSLGISGKHDTIDGARNIAK